MSDLNNLLSFSIGVAAPLVTQFVMYYITNKHNNRKIKMEDANSAINIIIQLTDFINDGYEFIKSQYVTDNDGHTVRIGGDAPEFNYSSDLDLKFLDKKTAFSIAVLPTRIKYIKNIISLHFEYTNLEDVEYMQYNEKLYGDLLNEVIEIRTKICNKFNLPKDKLFDLSNVYP
ncbi:hypothetical protein Q4R25_16945 [Morganella morganii]